MNIITEKLDQFYFLESNTIITELYEYDMSRIDSIITESLVSNKIDKLQESYNKNIKLVEKYLYDKGININRIRSSASKVAESVKNDFKNKKDPKEIQNKIIKSAYKIVKTEVSSVAKKYETMSTSEKIVNSLIIFVLVLFMNSLAAIIATIFFGPQLATTLLTILLAPLIEEAAKKFAIEEGYPWIYTGIFAGLEMAQYVVQIIAAGGILVPALIVRLLALMMHFGTTYVQKYYQEKGQTDSTTDWAMVGYCLGVFIHVLWNVMGTVYNEPISSFVGI